MNKTFNQLKLIIMADETKTVYCMDSRPDNSALWASLMSGKQESPAELMALMNSNNFNNNPFIWLVFMWLFRGGMWGANGAEATAENYNSRQIATLSDTVNTNHNNQIALDAIKGNSVAIGELATTFNTDFNTISTALCGIRSAVENVSASVGYSSEKVINAINLGDANLMSKMQDCCCSTKTAILEQGYQNQLANERQTNILSSAIEGVRQATVNGFSQIGYQMASDKADIINAQNANTQRILDQMCANTTQTLRDQIAEKDRQLQTQSILNQLKNSGCNCGGCGC